MKNKMLTKIKSMLLVFSLFLFSVLIFFTGTAKVNALSLSAADSDYTVHYMFQKTYYRFTKIPFLDMEGRTVLCIDMDTKIKEGEGYSESDFLSEDRWELAATCYFAWFIHKDENDADFYRAASQSLIWEKANGLEPIDFTYKGQSVFEKYKTLRDSVRKEISRLHTMPSFAGKKYTVNPGSSLELTDSNSVLSQYTVALNETGAEIINEGEKLTLNFPEASLSGRIVFEKYSSDFTGTPIIYTKPNSQNVAFLKIPEQRSAEINIDIIPNTADVSIIKKDGDTGDVLRGAEFRLFPVSIDSQTENFEMQGFRSPLVEEGLLPDIISDDGVCTWKKIKFGEYEIREIKAPKSYVRDPEPIRFTLNEESSPVIQLESKNFKSCFTISKSDITDASPVPGAEIKIFDEGGEELCKAVSGEDGKAEFDGLETGKKYFFEESAAPEGYRLNTERYEFFLNEDGIAEGVMEISDEPSRLSLLKLDERGIPLAGAGFQIFDEGGKKYRFKRNAEGVYVASASGETDELISDSKGKIEIMKLPFGKIRIKESLVPEGKLKMDDRVVELKDIKGENADLLVKLVNRDVPVFPETGEKVKDSFFPFVLLSLGSVLSLLKLKRMKQ